MNGLCSHERLEHALAGSLNADEESTLHLHLEDCELCAAEMERLAGGEQASREIAAMLIPDDLDDALPLREECSTADFVVDHLEPSDDPAVLGRLGGYDVLDIIGRGGMGVVLKGFDRELKRFVAIKALAPHLAHSALARKRFAREAQAAAAVVNLHVIAIHQVQPNGQLPFLVMPLLTGESLAQRLKSRGTLELKEILRIGMQAAEGLAAAHGQGLIHRDVKPANILLEKGVERAVLTDFGLARAADDVSMTRQGIIAGTPEYMSPEQARGEALDGRSDLFSLGCVLYEMATGVSPYRTDSTMATLRRIVDEQPAAMASLVPELPPWFSHIVERLLSKDPAQRFASASEVSQLLEQCLSHLQQPTSVPLPASLVPHATGRRSIFNVTRKGVIAMLGTIGMTLLGMVLWQATEAPDISGQWTSDEWGTVVLEAKGPGEYEGTFTGSGKDKPALRNAPPGDGTGGVLRGLEFRSNVPAMGPAPLAFDFPSDVPHFGVSPKSGPDAFRDSVKTKSGAVDSNSQQKFQAITGFMVRDNIIHVDLGSVLDKPPSGTLHLKWSRVERRFNGTWGKGDDRTGTMSLRLVDKEIRGGWTTDEEVQLESGTPLVGDLLWKRSVVTVPDGGTVLLGGLDTAKQQDGPAAKKDAERPVFAVGLEPATLLFKQMVELFGPRGMKVIAFEEGKTLKIAATNKEVVEDFAKLSELVAQELRKQAEPGSKPSAEKSSAVSLEPATSLAKSLVELFGPRGAKVLEFEAGKRLKVEAPRDVFLDLEKMLKLVANETSLDRQNARAVVEAFVAAALAGDGETVITLAKLNRRDPKRPTERIENMIKCFPDREHLPMTSVHVNDAETPTDAIAISKQFKWEHPSSERKADVVAWFTLSMSEAGWIVTNISFEWIESTDGLLKKFLEANPKSIRVPPQAQ